MRRQARLEAKIKVVYEAFDWRALANEYGEDSVIGVDEVGRGCLAGPVYACAAILPNNFDFEAAGVTDSKLLSEKRRESLAALICEHARVSIGIASEAEIAERNILGASLLAMRRAVEGLGIRVGHALIDGNQGIPGLHHGLRQLTLIKGDMRATPIAAASIVAKHARDRMMIELAQEFPEYGFDSNKGYASADHLQAIVKHGPCRRHRWTFRGVREHWHRVRPDGAQIINEAR